MRRARPAGVRGRAIDRQGIPRPAGGDARSASVPTSGPAGPTVAAGRVRDVHAVHPTNQGYDLLVDGVAVAIGRRHHRTRRGRVAHARAAPDRRPSDRPRRPVGPRRHRRDRRGRRAGAPRHRRAGRPRRPGGGLRRGHGPLRRAARPAPAAPPAARRRRRPGARRRRTARGARLRARQRRRGGVGRGEQPGVRRPPRPGPRERRQPASSAWPSRGSTPRGSWCSTTRSDPAGWPASAGPRSTRRPTTTRPWARST